MSHRKLYYRQVLQPSMIKDESNKHIPDITWFLQVWYFWFCGNSAIIENISPATRLWYDPGQGRQIGEILLPWSNLVGVSKKWKGQDDICRKTLRSVQVLVVAGGTGNAAANYAALDSTEILHQTDSGAWASTWTYGPRLPRALSAARAAALDYKLLLTGGMDEQETYQDSVNAGSMKKSKLILF